MSDNFYIEDLILSIAKETTMDRYLPLAEYRDRLIFIMRQNGILFRDGITDSVIGQIGSELGADIARLFARFIHIYDFKPEKLKEIKQYEGSEKYTELKGLLRLPGVRILRAELYFNSGVTLKILAECQTEEIRDMVSEYIRRENRSEIVPLAKEVNCHRAVARMILHLENGKTDGNYQA